jgi:hypothetical protein
LAAAVTSVEQALDAAATSVEQELIYLIQTVWSNSTRATTKAGSGEYFLKAGPDSPDNLLVNDDFDVTANIGMYRKSFEAHEINYKIGDLRGQKEKEKD